MSYSESESDSNSLLIFASIFSKSESKSDSESDFNSVFMKYNVYFLLAYYYPKSLFLSSHQILLL